MGGRIQRSGPETLAGPLPARLLPRSRQKAHAYPTNVSALDAFLGLELWEGAEVGRRQYRILKMRA